MKDAVSFHKKIQELCDCYATSYPLKGMSDLKMDEDKEEAALKWIALAALHGIGNDAKKITIKTKGGNVEVTAEYRKAYLPDPGADVGTKVIEAIKDITHIEKKGKLPLALGIRNSSVELMIKIKSDEDGDKVTIKFPKENEPEDSDE